MQFLLFSAWRCCLGPREQACVSCRVLTRVREIERLFWSAHRLTCVSYSASQQPCRSASTGGSTKYHSFPDTQPYWSFNSGLSGMFQGVLQAALKNSLTDILGSAGGRGGSEAASAAGGSWQRAALRRPGLPSSAAAKPQPQGRPGTCIS